MSNEIKHTPGPWLVEQGGCDGSGEFGINAHTNKGTFYVAETIGGLDEEEENARLIAAAPELLETLIHIEEYWNRDQNETAMANALWHIIDEARSAIVKARGE